jgi:alpha-tubulin suppressor-like RCC1 family protein
MADHRSGRVTMAGMGRVSRFTFAVLTLVTAVVLAEPADAAPTPERSDWRMVTTGGFQSCGLRTDGRLFCWGGDDTGLVGNGLPLTSVNTPVEVAGGFRWTTVSAGVTLTCARRTTGQLYCWGLDTAGQLGNGPGTTGTQASPTLVVGGTTWTSVTTGATHACGRRTNGRLYCWGSDFSGQLGDGPAGGTTRTAPVAVAGGITDWTATTAGDAHTCARRSTGRLYCWGSDGAGQLGDGAASTGRVAPQLVAGGFTDWTAVDAGQEHTCGRRATGRLYCWGDDEFGQLGDGGPNGSQTVPSLVPGPGWRSVSAGTDHTCGIRTTRRLYCWGEDAFGRLGNGTSVADTVTPGPAFGGDTDWAAVAAGGAHTCARITSGRLFCWGYDNDGAVGNGPTVGHQESPVLIADG